MSIAHAVMTSKAARFSVKRSYGLVAFFLLVANLRPALTGAFTQRP
jgi:hypothetical protein